MAFVYGEIGDGKDVPARLHRANVIRDVFGGAKPIHAALARFKPTAAASSSILRDGTAGVPVAAIPQDGDTGTEAARTQAMARDRPRRADLEGPRHFLDPAADLQPS